MALEWINRDEADALGAIEEQVLLEQTPDYYPEFGAFMKRELEGAGGDLFFRGNSGIVYRVGRLSSSDRNELQGIEICARMAGGGQTLAGEDVDTDLWPFFEWLIEGVGGEWSVEALRTTGSIYKIPGAPEKS
jgi:hypothetical protein